MRIMHPLPCLAYLQEKGPVSIIFIPKPEEFMFKNQTLAKALIEASYKVLSDNPARWIILRTLLRYIYAPTLVDHYTEDVVRDYYQEKTLRKENIMGAYVLYRRNRLAMQNIGNVMKSFEILLRPHCKFLQKETLIKKSEEILKRFLLYGLGEPSISEINEDNYDRIDLPDKIILSDMVAGLARSICIEIIEEANRL